MSFFFIENDILVIGLEKRNGHFFCSYHNDVILHSNSVHDILLVCQPSLPIKRKGIACSGLRLCTINIKLCLYICASKK